MLQEGFGPLQDLHPSAPEALDGWIHLALRPCFSRAQLPTLLMEIGKFLVSEGVLVFPGGRSYATGGVSTLPRRIHLPEELCTGSPSLLLFALC